jgi:hypothetical protein
MKKTVPAPRAAQKPAVRAPLGEPELTVGLGAATGIYLVLALIFFLPAFLPGQHIYGTDYIGGGYFFYHFISERLGEGALPKWVPYVFGGMPLFANPGSTFHPVHFLADLLVPTSRVLPMVFVAHFWVAGVGMYLLARELGCRSWVAFVAGLAFQFTGITTSWVYAGHDGRIIVATLAPLLFFFLHAGIRTARLGWFAGAAATLGVALLSFQIQNSYYLLLAGGIWAVFCLVHLEVFRRRARFARVVALGLGSVAFGFLLAAVNFLPFLGYVPESPRGMEGGRGYEFAISFSMPPAELLSVAVPEQHGVSVADPQTGRPLFPGYQGQNPFKLHTEYVGALVVVLLALGAFHSRRDRYWWFFAGLALFMLTIALGGHTPLYRLYFAVLPGTQQFRAPSLSFFVVAFALVSMAALTLERVLQLREASRQRRRGRSTEPEPLARLPWVAGAVVGLAVLGMATAGTGVEAPGAPSRALGWARFAFFAALVGAALWLWVRESLSPRVLAVALAVITLTDLWVMGRRFLHTIDPPEATFAADDVISFLRAQPGPFRIWTFPFPQHYRGAGAYGGNFPMHFGIDQVGGEHPNMLQRWVEYVGPGTVTYIDWGNLIQEASVVETPEGQAIAFRAAPGMLEAANVRYVVSMAPLSHPTLREVHRGSALVYENVAALPRAYLPPTVVPIPAARMVEAMLATPWDPAQTAYVAAEAGIELPDAPLAGEAAITVYEPDRVVVQTRTDRAALLVLADNHYDGWRAEVNGQRAEVVLANHTFRGVVVPAGEQTVEFTFRPPPLYTGLYITVAGFVLLGILGVVLLVRERRRGEPPSEVG